MKRFADNYIENNIAQESILFQNGMLFKELTLAFTELKASDKKSIEDNEFLTTIPAIIKHYTGISTLLFLGIQGPMVEIPLLDKNHPLVNNYFRNSIISADGIKMIHAAKDGVLRGTVNLKTSTVTGIFSDIVSNVLFPIEMITGKTYLPEELAAFMLHELGHLFTYFEYITRTVTTNQVLAGMSKALDNSGTVEEREAVLINVQKVLKLSELDVKKLAISTNTKVAEIVVITNIVKTTKSEIGTNIYDFKTWEYLCDEFAARHGAGRYIVTALDKAFHEYGHRSFRSLPVFLGYEALKLVMLLSPFIISGLFMILMDCNTDGSYDEPGARMKRVRNQIVQNLKDSKLTKEDQLRLIADLECIDKILNKVNDRRQFFGMLVDLVSSSARQAYNQEKMQQELESIAINELFVKSANLKQLS